MVIITNVDINDNNTKQKMDEQSKELATKEDASNVETITNEATATEQPKPDLAVACRGIHIRFPGYKVQNIALVSCTSLSLQMQCIRCKSMHVVQAIQPRISRRMECERCHATGSILFRPELMPTLQQVSSVLRDQVGIGYLDVDVCDVADFLPSTIVVTCSNCTGTTDASDMEISGSNVLKRLKLGEPRTITCRFCHTHLLLHLEQVRFIRIGAAISSQQNSSSNESQSNATRKAKKPTKEPGIVPGKPLPNNGSCAHYKKSYRWLRFPCWYSHIPMKSFLIILDFCCI
jgi:hypothetical protein